MEKETIQEYQVKYFKDINRAVDVQQLVNLIQYGANGKDWLIQLKCGDVIQKKLLVNLRSMVK